MFITKESQLILRHAIKFKNKNIFFSGNIQDIFPAHLLTIKTKIHIQRYHDQFQFHIIKKNKKISICYECVVTKKMTKNYNVLIYYWPKNKYEAYFQLMNILASFKIGSEIFLIGDNCSGIKSALKILSKWIVLKTLERAKHSILLVGILLKNSTFIFNDFFKKHFYKNVFIQTLPGLFDYKDIDNGSKFLVSTFSNKMRGSVLDIGSGSGFLSVFLGKNVPNINLTLIDNNIYALKASTATLKGNFINGEVLLSDLYSHVSKKFNIIISNPPFHNDLKVNFNITRKIISEAPKYLIKNGEFRFVTNSCFSYSFLLHKNFKTFKILEKNQKYKIYQAFL